MDDYLHRKSMIIDVTKLNSEIAMLSLLEVKVLSLSRVKAKKLQLSIKFPFFRIEDVEYTDIAYRSKLQLLPLNLVSSTKHLRVKDSIDDIASQIIPHGYVSSSVKDVYIAANGGA